MIVMKLNEIKGVPGAIKEKKRVGRGPSSGHGKTCGRGTKGQKARSGGKIHPWFEGGQTPLHRRVPKRGFTNIFKKVYQVVNVGDLNRCEGEETVTPEVLREKGLIKKLNLPVKILGDGELNVPLTVRAHAFSESARSKIEAVGGRAEVI